MTWLLLFIHVNKEKCIISLGFAAGCVAIQYTRPPHRPCTRVRVHFLKNYYACVMTYGIQFKYLEYLEKEFQSYVGLSSPT